MIGDPHLYLEHHGVKSPNVIQGDYDEIVLVETEDKLVGSIYLLRRASASQTLLTE